MPLAKDLQQHFFSIQESVPVFPSKCLYISWDMSYLVNAGSNIEVLIRLLKCLPLLSHVRF